MAISLDQMRRGGRELTLVERIYGRKRQRFTAFMRIGLGAGAAYFAVTILAHFVR